MDKKIIVLTLYGTGEAINDFTVQLFEEERYGESFVHDYCSNINELELKDDKWIHASIVEENKKIKFIRPGDTDFDVLGTLDDRSIQNVIHKIDDNVLAQALKGAKNETLKAVLRNMTKGAARALIENMKCMDPILSEDIKKAQRQVVKVMRYLMVI